jgi:putative transposase
MKLTLKIKLVTDQAQKQALLSTMHAYNAACDLVSRFAFENQVFNNYSLHHALYKEIREKHNLPSQLAVSVMSKVADAYKTELTKATKERRPLALCRFKKSGAIVYDARLLSYGKESFLSIKTLDSRLKLACCIYKPETLPYFQGEADLLSVRGEFYLAQTYEAPKNSPLEIKGYLGVDLGIVKIATDSDGDFYSGATLEKKRQKYERHRSAVKQKKTKNGRRRLKKVGDREARFRKDVNHQISKRLVEKASRTCQGIALEDLQQFFDKTRVRQSQRAQRSSWSFFELRFFVDYKARLAGIPVVLVDPAYTSQACFACKHVDRANRKSQSEFLCVACGHTQNADVNAAKNIAFRAAVNQPIAASLVSD